MKPTAGGLIPRPPAHLVARLRMLVVDGVLAPGRPEQIAHVARMLNIDEPLARAVLMELGRDGFLGKVGEDSVRVRLLTETPEDGIIELRRLVEPVAIRAAAEHARTIDLVTLRDLADRVCAAVEDRKYFAFRRADDAFANTLLSLHPNAELTRLCADLRMKTAYDGLRVPIEQGLVDPDRLPHPRMVDLIEAGDLQCLEELSLAVVDRLHFVGAPRMDAPYLVGPPLVLDPHVDEEFLDAATDA